MSSRLRRCWICRRIAKRPLGNPASQSSVYTYATPNRSVCHRRFPFCALLGGLGSEKRDGQLVSLCRLFFVSFHILLFIAPSLNDTSWILYIYQFFVRVCPGRMAPTGSVRLCVLRSFQRCSTAVATGGPMGKAVKRDGHGTQHAT